MSRLLIRAAAVTVLVPLLALAWPTAGRVEARRRRSYAERYRGRLFLTQKPIPKRRGRGLLRWLRAHRTITLVAGKPGRHGLSWSFHYYAQLLRRPARAVLYLVAYEYLGRGRYKYINADYLTVKGLEIRGEHALHEALYFKRGRRYQVRITLRDAFGNEVVYAKTRLFTLL